MNDLPPAGWYPNPEGEGQRYWDGERWTDRYSQAGASRSGDASFFADLFDTSFTRFVTPRLIPVLFVLGLVLLGLWLLLAVISGFATEEPGVGIGFLIVAPLIFLLGALYLRVLLEVMIQLFKVREGVDKLVELSSSERSED